MIPVAAGAYKGLTIKIGADLTKLSTSLRSADSAIFKTQAGLNKLAKAARIDPGNTSVMTSQMGALAEQAINAATKMDILSKGIKELSEVPLKGMDGKSITKLAEDTDSVTLAAERASIAYTKVNAKLKAVYSEVKKQSGVDVRAVTQNGNFDEKWLMKQDKLTDEQKAKILGLKKDWTEARNALDDYANIQTLQKMNQDLVAQQASYNAINRQIAETSRQLSQLDSYKSGPLAGMGDSLKPLNDQLALISDAADISSERFKSLESSLTLDYGGVDVTTERMDALNNAIEESELRAEKLKEKISFYDANGVGRLVDDMGNVAMEVELSEQAFIKAKTDLDMFKASGEDSTETMDKLKAAVEQAQQRMDTAHACQQYQNLKTQLHDARSEAINLAQKLVDVSKPSTVASSSGVRQISRDIEYIGASMRQVESQSRSMSSALKLNPENMAAATRQAELLAEATKLATEEGEELKEKLAQYDLSAIDGATDSTKSAAKQVLDAAENLDKANEKVRDIEKSMTSLQESMDSINLNDPAEGELDAFYAMAETMTMLREQSDEAKTAAKEAFAEYDLSKQRKEVEDLRTKQVENIATVERLAGQSRALSMINATPRFDTSFTDAMKQALDEMRNGTLANDAMGDVAKQLEDAGAAADHAKDRFERLDNAAKLDPTNIDTARQRAEALVDAISTNEREMEMLKKGMQSLPADQIDHAAIAAGTVGEKVSETTRRFDEATSRAKGYEDTINALNAQLRQLEGKDVISDKDAADIENIKAQIELLTQSAKSFADENTRAFKDMNGAAITQQYQEMETRMTELTSRSRELKDTMSEIKVESDMVSSLKPVDDQLKVMTSALDTAKDRFETLSKAADIKPYSIKAAVEQVKALREATNTAQQKAELLQQKLNGYKATGIDKLASKTTNAAAEFERAQKHVNDLNTKLAETVAKEGETSAKAQELRAALDDAFANAKTAAAVNEFKNVETELRKIQTESKSMKNSMKADFGEVGAAAVQAATTIGNLVERAGRYVTSSSDEVDKSYRDLRKTFDAEEADYEKLYDAAMKYSQGHVTSADTMLEMEAIAAQLGVGIEGGADAIQKFAEVAANLDVATDIDADTIALQMGQISAVMKDLSTDNIDKFGDALVRLGNNMPTQESNIMQITQRLSAIGDVAGFSTPELMGWAAAIASTGQKSEAAASGIATTITKITQAVDAGGDDLEKFAKVAGKSAEQFAADWKSKPSETLKEFMEKLGESEQLFADLTDMDINGIRQTQTLAALAQTVGKVDDSIKMADDAFHGLPDEFGEAGDAAREAERKSEGFSGSLAKMKNSAQVLAATFGDTLAPYLDTAATAMQKLTDFINSLDDSTKDLIVKAGLLAVGFSTVYPVLSALLGPMGKLITGLGKFGVKGIAGAFTGISTTVGAIGDAFLMASTTPLSLADSLVRVGKSTGGFMGGISKAIGSVQDFGAAISLFAHGDVATIGEALATSGEEVGLFGSALSFLMTPLGAVVGAIATIGTALAVDYVGKQMKAKKAADDFKTAIDGIEDVTSNLGQSLYLGGDAIEDYGEKWSAARVDMEKYHESLKKHTDAQLDARKAMETTVGSLERYQSIIMSAVGKGDDFTGNIGELKWALDELNALTGSSWTLQDILTGKYKDEEGAIRDTKAALDELIESKKREAQIDGIEKALSENVAAREENKIARETAANNYQNWIDMKLSHKDQNPMAQGMTDSQYIKWLQANDEHTQELLVSSKNLREEARLLDQQYVDLTNTLGGLVHEGSYATTSNYGERESIMRLGEGIDELMKSYLGFTDGTIEQGVKDIAQGMQDMKVGTTEFAEMAPSVFENLLQQADGSSEKFVQLVSDWNKQHLEEKYAIIKWNGDDSFETAKHEIYEWNGNEYVAKVSVDTSGVTEGVDQAEAEANNAEAEMTVTANTDPAEETMASISDGEVQMNVSTNADEAAGQIQSAIPQDTEVHVTIVADTAGVQQVNDALATLQTNVQVMLTVSTTGVLIATERLQNLNSIASTMQNVDRSYTATGNAVESSTPADNVNSLNSAASNMVSKEISLTAVGNAADGGAASNVWNLVSAISNMHDKSITLTTTNVTTDVKKAAGTYINPNKIPKHAAGIFTRPTLTNIGWVGEDGAELYSGNSLVPLTNRKYSMPYIDDISDAVAKKLGGLGTVNNYYVNDAIVNGDAEIQAAFLTLFDTLTRKGAMNVG